MVLWTFLHDTLHLQRGGLDLLEMQPKPAEVMRRHHEHGRPTETMSAAASTDLQKDERSGNNHGPA